MAIGVSSSNANSFDDFFKAVELDNVRGVAELLQRGFDPNAADANGDLALLLAVKHESPKVFGVLLAHPGIKVDAVNASGETALMMAAIRGANAECSRLIERGAAINRNGWTPLHYAASGPAPEIVKLLLAKGAMVDAPSPNGTTPLMMAARYGAEDSVMALLAQKANPRLRNQVDKTAADFARSAGRDSLAARLEQSAR